MFNNFIDSIGTWIIWIGIGIILPLAARSRLNNQYKNIDAIVKNYKITFAKSGRFGLNEFQKRIIDIIYATVGILLVLPLFPLIALAIKLDSRGPVFFFAKRKGQYKRDFHILKFRTMYMNAVIDHRNYAKAPNDPRITRLGRFLRNSNLADLPLLFNVLKGEMSLVGISTVTEFEHKNIDERTKEYLAFSKPGIISLWAVSGAKRNFSYEERIKYDLYYVENMSPWLDAYIILKAVTVALGVTAEQ